MTAASPRPPDSGSIVLGWLTKITLWLVVVGVLVFDGIALVTATFTVTDHAGSSAREAAAAYKSTKDVQAAYAAAQREASRHLERVERTSFLVRPADGQVTLTQHKTATTLWMHRIGPLKKYTDRTGVGEANPPS